MDFCDVLISQLSVCFIFFEFVDVFNQIIGVDNIFVEVELVGIVYLKIFIVLECICFNQWELIVGCIYIIFFDVYQGVSFLLQEVEFVISVLNEEYYIFRFCVVYVFGRLYIL